MLPEREARKSSSQDREARKAPSSKTPSTRASSRDPEAVVRASPQANIAPADARPPPSEIATPRVSAVPVTLLPSVDAAQDMSQPVAVSATTVSRSNDKAPVIITQRRMPVNDGFEVMHRPHVHRPASGASDGVSSHSRTSPTKDAYTSRHEHVVKDDRRSHINGGQSPERTTSPQDFSELDIVTAYSQPTAPLHFKKSAPPDAIALPDRARRAKSPPAMAVPPARDQSRGGDTKRSSPTYQDRSPVREAVGNYI